MSEDVRKYFTTGEFANPIDIGTIVTDLCGTHDIGGIVLIERLATIRVVRLPGVDGRKI